jgi:hypothetical protein
MQRLLKGIISLFGSIAVNIVVKVFHIWHSDPYMGVTIPVATFTIDFVFENCFLFAMTPYVDSRGGWSLSIYGSECQIWKTRLYRVTDIFDIFPQFWSQYQKYGQAKPFTYMDMVTRHNSADFVPPSNRRRATDSREVCRLHTWSQSLIHNEILYLYNLHIAEKCCLFIWL